MGNKAKSAYYFVAPATGSTLANLLRLNFDHFPVWIPLRYWLKMPIVFLVAAIFAPFNLYERIRYARTIKGTKVEDPIFILGHWRSGTTHLHYLMTQNKDLGFTTNLQCLFPSSFLTNPLVKVFLKALMPETRPMDNMKLELLSPQEDELGTANLMLHSFYNAWYFPKSLFPKYKKYVRFAGVSNRKKEQWKRKYLRMLKKATIFHEGKRLILKNPAHTARVSVLLEMFPNAKFIHISRDPVTVYFSTKRLYTHAMPSFALQSLSDAEISKGVLDIYEDLMKSYFEERELIPENNLFEMKFEDLVQDRIGVLAKLHEQLELKGWKGSLENLKSYLDNIKDYQKNKHEYAEEECEKVFEQWAFAFHKMNYSLPSSPNK